MNTNNTGTEGSQISTVLRPFCIYSFITMYASGVNLTTGKYVQKYFTTFHSLESQLFTIAPQS